MVDDLPLVSVGFLPSLEGFGVGAFVWLSNSVPSRFRVASASFMRCAYGVLLLPEFRHEVSMGALVTATMGPLPARGHPGF